MFQTSLLGVETEAEKKFREFHDKNPKVFQELLQLTRQARNAGRNKIGINMLVEVVRWNRFLQTTDLDFKINNNYAPRYARLIMESHPEFTDIFNTRGMRD